MTAPSFASTPAPSHAAVVWAARQVVRQHREDPDPVRATGRCSQCTDVGCRLLDWAEAVLAPHLVDSVS
jgi:hypothetical protein